MGEPNKVREALRDEVLSEFKGLKTLTIGSKEHSAAVEDLTKLYGLIIKDLDGDQSWMNQSDKIELDKYKLNQEKAIKEAELTQKNEELEKKVSMFEAEQKLKEEQFKSELEMRQKELDEQVRKNEFDRIHTEREREDTKKDNIVDYGIRGAGIVLPLIFYGAWLKMGMSFEEKGTFTSATFKGLFNKFKPTRID